VVTPAVSPYDTVASLMAMRHFRSLLERRVDFDGLGVVDDPTRPMLLLGAVDVRSGDFVAFNSRRDRISPEMVLASAAIPTLFRAVHVDGRSYWDGLFSQNPPVRELLDATPDEIWVIQVNPRRRPDEPRTVVDIADRRNELSGNLSLHQELHFIEKINQLLDDGLLAANDRYRNVTIRVIELTRTRLSRAMGTTSKLNRDPGFIHELMTHGVARAEEFVAALAFEDAWRRREIDDVVRGLADDAEVVVAAPFGDPGAYRGTAQVRDAVARLTRDVAIDVTRTQVCQDAVVWSLRTGRDDGRAPERSWAAARFGGGGITSLRLGTAAAADREAARAPHT
jgi:NTE family protein